jgi:predicted secreted protein
VVDDPPIVVQREINEQGQVVSEQRVPTAQAQAPAPLTRGRVIHAEAEVTILGPDSMSIRLYRKNDGRDANAKAAAKHKKSSKNQKSQPEG